MITLAFCFAVVIATTLLPHLETFSSLHQAGVSNKVIFSFIGVINSNTTTLSLVLISILGLLMGVYVVTLTSYVKQYKLSKSSISGIGGSLLGFLGIGCAACGSIILTPLLGLIGATSVIALLPLGGEEFIYIGILVLFFSIRSLIRKMSKPVVCKI